MGKSYPFQNRHNHKEDPAAWRGFSAGDVHFRSKYAAGDDAMRRITNTLSAALRPSDFLGRWRMGDEFIVILPATKVYQAAMVGERLRVSIEQASRGWLFPTSISMGISYYPKHGYTANQLLEAAEKALILAKMAGKNRVIVAS